MFACARKGMTNDHDKARMSSPAIQDREPIEERRKVRRRLCLVGSRMCSMMLVFISQPHSVHRDVCIAFDRRSAANPLSTIVVCRTSTLKEKPLSVSEPELVGQSRDAPA